MALTERYVTTTGAGAHDGTDEANAFSLTEAVTDANTPHAGYRYNVKAGTYSLGASVTPTGDGSTTSPIIFRGYSATIGDLDAQGCVRSSGGALNTTNFPVLAFGSTFRWSGNGDFFIFQNLVFTGAVSNSVLGTGGDATVINCSVTNTSTNAAAVGILCADVRSRIINCDVVGAGASGGTAAVNVTASNALVVGCRLQCPAAVGIKSNQATGIFVNNTIFGVAIGIQLTATTAIDFIIGNTIYGATGDGIDIVTSTTAPTTIVGNHITDCGGYAVDWNTSTCVKVMPFNRTRDNTVGVIRAADDWTDGATIGNVTTDTGTATTDFTNPGTDFSLIAAAPGISKGPGYLVDIGANGTPVVTAGGGMLINPGFSGGLRG